MDKNTIPGPESDGSEMRVKFREMNQRIKELESELKNIQCPICGWIIQEKDNG